MADMGAMETVKASILAAMYRASVRPDQQQSIIKTGTRIATRNNYLGNYLGNYLSNGYWSACSRCIASSFDAGRCTAQLLGESKARSGMEAGSLVQRLVHRFSPNAVSEDHDSNMNFFARLAA